MGCSTKTDNDSKRLRPYIIPISMRGDQQSQYERYLKKELKQGHIPSFLREGNRLVGEGESLAADLVIHYVKGLVNKLSQASTGKDAPELVVFLSDQKGSNTGVIPAAKTPILIVGLDMIDLIKQNNFGEDHLAAILGHERFHLRRHEKWSDLNNGRPEEAGGDLYGLYEAELAGYNPKAMGDMFKAFKREVEGDKRRKYKGWGSTLGDLLAVHPEINARIRNTELGLAELQLRKRMTEEQTELPIEVVNAANSVIYKTRFERYQEDTDYYNASPDEQVDLIGDYMDRVFDEKDPCLMQLHLFEMVDAIEELRKTPGIYDSAADWFRYFMAREHPNAIDIGDSSYERFYLDETYSWIIGQFIMLMSPLMPQREYEEEEILYNSYYKPGQFDDRINVARLLPDEYTILSRESEAFWEAETYKDAVEAAKRFEKALVIMQPYKEGLRALEYPGGPNHSKRTMEFLPRKESWPGRGVIKNQLEKEGFVLLPWHNHLKWALETENKEEAELIGRVSGLLGCEDTRMPGVEKDWFNNDYYGYKIEDLTFDKQGRIVSIPLTEEELKRETRKRFEKETAAALIQSEYDLSQEREKAEDTLVRSIDWRCLRNRKHYYAFIEQYAEHLQPPITLIPGRFPFAERFISELKTLADNEPEKWYPIYYEFLVGHRPPRQAYNYQGDRFYDFFSGRDSKYTKNTLPYLIKHFEDWYIGGHIKSYGYMKERGTLPEGHPMYELLMSYKDRTRTEKKLIRGDDGEYHWQMIEPENLEPHEHTLNIDFKIDQNHPYLEAFLGLKANTVFLKERADILSEFNWIDRNADSMDGLFIMPVNLMLEYDIHKEPRDFDRAAYTTRSRDSMGNHRVIYASESLELLRTLKYFDEQEKAGNPQRFDVSKLDHWMVTRNFEQDEHQNTRFWFDQEIAKEAGRQLAHYVDKQVERNKCLDFAPETSLKTLIKNFKSSHGREGLNRFSYNVFLSRPDLEEEYYQEIKRRIDLLPVQERGPYLESVLSEQIKDPDYRKWAMNSWLECSVLFLGMDDGSAEYADKAIEYLKESVYRMHAAQGIKSATSLLEEVRAQKIFSFETKEFLMDHFGQKFLQKDMELRLLEAAVETCSHDPVLRDAFLKFITEPVSEQGSRIFITLLKQRASQSEFVKMFFDRQKNLRMEPAQENMFADHLHRNIWDLPFALRTVYIDRVLFPVQEEDDQKFDEAVTFVLDKVLPEDRKFAKEARESLLIYLDTCPEELKRTTFSAILATTEASAKTGEMRPGQVLSFVLTRTGAAGGQLLQAGHSYLNGMDLTDPDLVQFRDDLLPSKEDFDRPLWWEIFERMDEVLPEEEKGDLVGALLGSGSTAFVVEYGADALKLTRKDLLPTADIQFERYLSCFEKLATRYDYYKFLPSMVAHADSLIEVAANGNIGAKQLEYAAACYDSLCIVVDEDTYNFHVSDVVSSGEEYLRMENIEGGSINKPTQKIDKRKISIAIEAAFIYRLLQGRAMDQDMHGGQQGINEKRIGMFDVGAIPYDLAEEKIHAPLPFEKRALGRLLGITLNAAMNNESPVQTFSDAVTDREWGEAKPYLVGIKKGFLARSDIHKGFGYTTNDRTLVFKDIFRAVWQAGQFDRDILNGLCESISLNTCKELSVYVLKNKSAHSYIEINDAALLDKRPTVSMSGMAGMIAKAALRRAFTKNETLLPVPANANDIAQEQTSKCNIV